RRALREATVEPADELVEEAGVDVAGGLASLATLLERRPDMTAVFCHHDLVAVGALAALRTLGRHVPVDCSVVGCDGLDTAASTNPPLTTVHVPFYEIGAEAMRVLLRLVAGGTDGARGTTLPGPLI